MDKIEYALVRTNSRAISISVKNGVVKVRSPRFLSKWLIDRFVKNNLVWIKESLEKESQDRRTYEAGDSFLFLNESYTIKLASQEQKENIVIIDDEVVFNREILSPKDAALDFYREKTLEMVGEFIGAFGIDIERRKIVVKLYQSKWGSLSAKSIAFNLKLAMAPKEVVKYVVAHELTHIKVFNHSKKFWQKLAEIYPDYRQQRKWIRDNSTNLKI